jgi:hypothetical protein
VHNSPRKHAASGASGYLEAPIPRLVAWIADVDSPAEWQLALLSSAKDRGSGLALVDARLAEEPDDVRARLARAVLLHGEGRHAEAEALASALIPLLSDAQIVALLRRFIEDERAELGRADRR